MEKESKIYVAGHKGLVGNAICRDLRRKGYTQIVTRSREDLDLTISGKVAEFFQEEKPDYVFLAAAKVGGIKANAEYRADFIYENLMIQTNVIHQSFLSGVKKLLFMGSTCIYPKNCPQPIKEEYLMTGPLEYTNEPYAIAKIAGFKMCESYNLQYGTNFISVMPTSLYGPGDNFDLETSHVLPALIRKMHLGKALKENDWETICNDLNKNPIEGVSGNGERKEILSVLKKYGIACLNEDDGTVDGEVSIEIWGSGTARREFLWSDDLADACVYLMENLDFLKMNFGNETVSFPEVVNTHINIGTGKDIPIRELAKIVKEITHFSGELIFNVEKPEGTFRKQTEISKLEASNWKYKVELEEGIDRLYKWYKESVGMVADLI